jgi:polyhydroxyalkanoate synthase
MNRLLRIAERTLRGRPPVGTTPADVIARENKWRLLRYRAPEGGRRHPLPVVLVPSLINRHYVLDLLPGRSFAEAMVREGHDVSIIDWGTPGPEDRHLTFDAICDRYIGRAVRAACRAAGTEQAHVLGYCLGGTLAVLHAAVRPERVASLTLLAAPVRFRDEGLLSRWTSVSSFDIGALNDAFGNVPWPLMQASFHLLKPTMQAAKLVGLVDRALDDEFLDGYFATETWGNDNVSFPGAAYRRYLEALYRDDALVNGTMTVSGRPARLESITCPTLAVTFEHDHIVPPASAAVVLERIGAARRERIHLPGGHVGAVVSKKAAAHLWPRLSAWWAGGWQEGAGREAPSPGETASAGVLGAAVERAPEPAGEPVAAAPRRAARGGKGGAASRARS